MEFETYLRKPYPIEAIEITEDNIEKLAKHIGYLRKHRDGTKYIFVNRKKVPNIDRVYPGFFMTRVKGNVRCYHPKAFHEHYVKKTPEMDVVVTHMNVPTP